MDKEVELLESNIRYYLMNHALQLDETCSKAQ